MTMTSIELTQACVANGLLSKTATEQVLQVRERIYREAMGKVAQELFGKQAMFGSKFLANKLGETGAQNAATIAKMLAIGAGLQAVGAGAGAVTRGVMNKIEDRGIKKDIEQSFSTMHQYVPELDNLPPEEIRRKFAILARFAPSLAADPTVAGHWVSQQIASRHVDADAIGRLSETQSKINSRLDDRGVFRDGLFSDSLKAIHSDAADRLMNPAPASTFGLGHDTY